MNTPTRIAMTIAAFFVGMLIVGMIRLPLTGPGGAIVGLIQIALFFGLPWLVWKATEPTGLPPGSYLVGKDYQLKLNDISVG